MWKKVLGYSGALALRDVAREDWRLPPAINSVTRSVHPRLPSWAAPRYWVMWG